MHVATGLLSILETARDLILPPHCAGCAKGIPEGWWCEDCREDLHPISPPRCESCSQPFTGLVEPAFFCPNCHGRVFHFECAIAVMPSRGAIRELIHGLKYRNMTWAAEPLAEFGVLGFQDPRMPDHPDFLVPVPLHPLRRRERGYNQAELLAQAISKRTGIPVLNILQRVRNTTTQTHFDRKQRMKNLRKAFKTRSNRQIKGRQILLVDDVLTTGSTMDECARELLAAGTDRVYALAIGRG